MTLQPTTPLLQPRAIGRAFVSSRQRAERSVIDGLRQSGALKAVFPRPVGDALEAVLINTAGGITGGDDFEIAADAGQGSALVLTTQAAERAYKALGHQTGRLVTRLTAAEGARLFWLPQETILYDGAALDRQLSVDLADDARFLMIEPVIFGRTAMGEETRSLRFNDRVKISRDGVPLFHDGARLHGDAAASLDRPATGGGARAMASLIYVAPDASAHLEPLRDLIGAAGGATLLREDVLAVRCLAPDGFELRKALLPMLDRLTRHTLPPCWRL